jgi:cell fate (sporulation/competence/biofilm development) regulator YlbF (YheA/YmcA/DUF963 family)
MESDIKKAIVCLEDAKNNLVNASQKTQNDASRKELIAHFRYLKEMITDLGDFIPSGEGEEEDNA